MSVAAPGIGRRALLKAGGAALTVGFLAGCALPVIPRRPAPDLDAAMGWIRHESGRFTLFLPRVEMGQNILTALKQIACEELDIGWDRLDAVLPDTSQIPRVRATVGSESIKDFALPLAQACATLREAVERGQAMSQVKAVERPASELRSMTGRAIRHVGRTAPLEQGEALVRGRPLFVADVRRPGQLHGRVLRAPASPELRSAPRSFDEAAARAVPGFVALVRDERLRQGGSLGLGIVARTPGALDRIEAALAVQWSIEGSFTQRTVDEAIDIDRRLAETPRRAKRLADDTMDDAGRWDVDLRLDVPLAAHAPIEPRAAVAEPRDEGGLALWVGSQDVFYQRDVVASRLGIDAEKVLVHGQRVGGAFGGKTICTVELEAALLAAAVRAPVKVQWTRAQEFRFGFYRPPSSHRIRARLKDGRIEAWWHAFASSHILFTNAVLPPWLQQLTDFIGDDGVARGAALPYRAAACHIGFDLARVPVLTGPWRGLGAGPNGFAIESAIDECARVAAVDPLRFRIDQAMHPRLVRVLECVAQAAAWNAPRPASGSDSPARRRGRGVACGIYKATSHAAVVAEVEVDSASGAVRVLRLVCAHDCGRVIHPDQVRAQCEGNLVWGLGMALIERLPVGDGQVAVANFAESPIPRFGQLPPMDVVLVDEGDAPGGAGETAIVAAAAAIANALRDATGWRATRLPVAASDVQQALASSRR